MANETTMHNACSVACMSSPPPPQQIKTEVRFGFVHWGSQEKLDFAGEE